ncbi:MAG: hypothetical protein QOG73_2082 [Acetobacteraceae bacterium]|jgi:hypothetical protein|nr:hypothetical protein [Acetobacteraceae bacterium]
MSLGDKQAVQASLRRLEALIAALDALPDPAAREPARELLELVLDLHGLALAKIVAGVAAGGDHGLLARLTEDPHIGAMLLLHGAHPEEPETRVRRALEQLRPRLEEHGARVISVRLVGGSLRLLLSGAGAPALRQEIEDAIIDAAPDLDDILFEELDEIAANATVTAPAV